MMYLVNIPQVDWDKATQAFGAKSVESMKVSYRNSLKKIEKFGGKNGVTATYQVDDDSAPSTPKAKIGRPPKRKLKTPASDDDDDDDDDNSEAPSTLRKRAARNIVRANDDADQDCMTAPKTPKKPRKTPVKSTKKVPLSKKAMDSDEDDDEEEVAEGEAVDEENDKSEV
jgi:hypothetical protein